MKARLYGRRWCHLCEEMAQALRAAGVAFEEIDVDADPALEERFGERVPVLTDAAGKELCHYRLAPDVVEKLR
ncbi:MAG TPA: glutaredoxin family protein [Burkholderiales bacterium]|nr:glutaredoxin family protein [Burkholderiales bacterium]